MEVLTLVALLLGPLIGIWANSKLDARKAAEGRKLVIFKALMANRGAPLSEEYVRALNGIDVEFNRDRNKHERAVVDRWRELNALFREGPQAPAYPAPGASDDAANAYLRQMEDYARRHERWVENTDEQRVRLYEAIANYFGYKFDRVQLAGTNAYRPMAFDARESLQQRLLYSATQVFEGQRPLAIQAHPPPAQNQSPSGEASSRPPVAQ